jgi:hypothetical protein
MEESANVVDVDENVEKSDCVDDTLRTFSDDEEEEEVILRDESSGGSSNKKLLFTNGDLVKLNNLCTNSSELNIFAISQNSVSEDCAMEVGASTLVNDSTFTSDICSIAKDNSSNEIIVIAQ